MISRIAALEHIKTQTRDCHSKPTPFSHQIRLLPATQPVCAFPSLYLFAAIPTYSLCLLRFIFSDGTRKRDILTHPHKVSDSCNCRITKHHTPSAWPLQCLSSGHPSQEVETVVAIELHDWVLQYHPHPVRGHSTAMHRFQNSNLFSLPRGQIHHCYDWRHHQWAIEM